MTKAQALTDRPVGWTIDDDERAVAAKEKWEIAGAALVTATEYLAALRADNDSHFLIFQAEGEVHARTKEWKQQEAAWRAAREIVRAERKASYESEYRKVTAEREAKIDEAVAAERAVRKVWQRAQAEGIELHQESWIHYLSPPDMWADAFTNWGDPPPWKFRRDALKAQGYL